jgi:hypothetical protein
LNTLTVFGVGHGNGLVVLSAGYPKVLVPSMLKTDMENCRNSGSRIFKKLIKSLIVDRDIWARNVGSYIQTFYPDQVGACYGEFLIKLFYLENK